MKETKEVFANPQEKGREEADFNLISIQHK
jgi:hypothetical protein